MQQQLPGGPDGSVWICACLIPNNPWQAQSLYLFYPFRRVESVVVDGIFCYIYHLPSSYFALSLCVLLLGTHFGARMLSLFDESWDLDAT